MDEFGVIVYVLSLYLSQLLFVYFVKLHALKRERERGNYIRTNIPIIGTYMNMKHIVCFGVDVHLKVKKLPHSLKKKERIKKQDNY